MFFLSFLKLQVDNSMKLIVFNLGQPDIQHSTLAFAMATIVFIRARGITT